MCVFVDTAAMPIVRRSGHMVCYYREGPPASATARPEPAGASQLSAIRAAQGPLAARAPADWQGSGQLQAGHKG